MFYIDSELPLASFSKRVLVHNSYKNEFNLQLNEISFSYERMGTKTRFEKEAKGNSEMAYFEIVLTVIITVNDLIYNDAKIRSVARVAWSWLLLFQVKAKVKATARNGTER